MGQENDEHQAFHKNKCWCWGKNTGGLDYSPYMLVDIIAKPISNFLLYKLLIGTLHVAIRVTKVDEYIVYYFYNGKNNNS